MEMPERVYVSTDSSIVGFGHWVSIDEHELSPVVQRDAAEYLRADIAQKTIEALTAENARLLLQIAQMGEVRK